jgi:3-oxoacyl-[acyl-carrier protein] reductase
MKENLNLQGKNALVCGSSKGIGRAVAFELADLGANITLVARSADKLSRTVDHLPNLGNQNHTFIVADFNKKEEVEERVTSHLENRDIHILINNTGGPKAGPLLEADDEELTRGFHNHVVISHMLAKLIVPCMKENEYGRIINIISISVKEPIPGLGVSNTIRGAMANWSKTMAGELGSYGITVNNVLPGYTMTERLDSIIERKAEKQELSKDEVTIQMKRNVPLRRFATPEEIAMAVSFLASPAAAYINGVNLPVDGGRTKSL